MTYLLISTPFLCIALVIAWLRRHISPRQWMITGVVMVVLLVLTAIFDNLMILVGLVGYGEEQRLGLQLWLVPVEDFLYVIFAALVIPALWLGGKR